ncbi:uncharacterized protein C11orf53 homolog isoform X1 [Scleropages formosus]|uniref:uncharacterized protein C11orf53 homolog isoform X1 n=1 Tax=Scleropages formosus TaxID=113540 RepID=UPI0010FAB5B5|nr:uncharacterized protein C11orf53 homolog isoform X1 [Scleropages formosus]
MLPYVHISAVVTCCHVLYSTYSAPHAVVSPVPQTVCIHAAMCLFLLAVLIHAVSCPLLVPDILPCLYAMNPISFIVPKYFHMSSVPFIAPHMLPGCYSLKRPFIHGTEFSSSHYPSKPPTTEAYSFPLEGKPLTYDPSSTTNYPMDKDNYYPEPFGEYRSSTYPTAAGALFTPSLSSLIPAYSGDPAHVFLRESWEQPEADPGNQMEGFCTEVLAPVPAQSSSVISTSPEPGSPSQCRTSGRSTGLPSPQLYPLQPLEEAHYSAAYLHHHSYTGAPYSTVSTDHTSRMPPLSIEEPDSTTATHSNAHCWANDDTGSSWSLYEFRKAF